MGGLCSTGSGSGAILLANPKSMSLTVAFARSLSQFAKRMFSGFRSLCAMLLSWMYCRTLSSCLVMFAAASSLKDPWLWILSKSSPPEAYSMIMVYFLPCS